MCWTHPQRQMLDALVTHDFVIYSGGNFAAKTYPAVAVGVGAGLGFFDCVDCHAHPDLKDKCETCNGLAWCPVPADVMLVGLAKSQARDAMQNYLKELIPPSQIHNATKREGLWEIVEMCNGSKITIYTVGQGSDTHQGGRRSLIVYDEQPTEDIVEEGIFRFREDMESKILITMTPTKGKSWVYDELILKAEEKDIALVHASVFENGANICRNCDKRDRACVCEISRYRRLECQTCNHDRNWWDDELRKLGARRQTEAADALCWRCRTYGVEPRLSAKKVRSAEKRVTDPKRLAMRLHGKWAELRGDRCFDPLEIQALYRNCKKPMHQRGGVMTYADRDGRKRYTIGVDHAQGTMNDETVINVLDVHSGEQVVVWADRETEAPVYIHEIAELSEEYGTAGNKAKVWTENIQSGLYLIPELDRMGVPLYRHRSPDKKRRKTLYNQMGFIPSPRNRDRLLYEFIAGLKLNLVWVCLCHEVKDCPVNEPPGKVILQAKKGGIIVRDRKTVSQIEKLFYNGEDGGKVQVSSGHDDRVFALAGAHECRQKVGGWADPTEPIKYNEQELFLLNGRTRFRRTDPTKIHPFNLGRFGRF